MPILFQYRNIRYLLGMYITKQAEQQIHTQLPKLTVGAPISVAWRTLTVG